MLDQIIESLILNIAEYSTMLNDTNVISSISFSGGSATLVLADTVASTLTVGRQFFITDAIFKNEIISLTPVSGGFLVETTVNHDLTEDINTTVEITGFGSSWDDTFVIDSVNSETTFTIITSLSAPVGTGYVLEDRYGTIREAQIITAFTTNTITFATTTPFELYDLTNAVINYNYRITSVFDDESAMRHYNQRASQKKPWAYVIYDDSATSKDNTIDSDSRAKDTRQNSVSQELMINFSILVIKDTSDYNTSQRVQDELLDFRFSLLKSVLGLKIDFSDYLNNQRCGVVYLGDVGAMYKGAYYMHIYNFQTQLIISTNETIENYDTAALRTFDIDLFLEADDYTTKKKEIGMEFPD